MAEQRDETHIEQHGDGDVNVTPAEPDTGSGEQQESGQSPEESDGES